ncbi:MAG: AAA family ATPase [Methylococcales bacterium]
MLPDELPIELDESKAANDTEKTPFPFIRASELTVSPVTTHWLIRGILEHGSLNLLFGEPEAGKSLFVLDWAFCVTSGIDWHEHRTASADVVIIAGEGFQGMSKRLKALESKYNLKASERLFISKRPADMIDPDNVEWVADTVMNLSPNTGLVIIDTLHRNMSGDENSSSDIAAFISNIDIYLKPLGCAVLIVHHSGHGQKDRSRGSSSIRAAMDGEFSAIKNDCGITLSCCKSKDFEAFKPLQFALTAVPLDWLDDDGEPLTSVYLEHLGEAKQSTKKRKLSARDDAILTSLNGALTLHGVEPTPEIKAKFAGFDSLVGRTQKIVNIDHWREQAFKAIVVDCENDDKKPDALKKAFKRCRDKLFNDGFTVEYGDYAWRIF